jgi:glycosyltransferase involved in cell wall biosynthesis
MRSIIVPTYNEEDRIRPALDALIQLKGVEIIVSDDGSADRTTEISKDYAKDNQNIKVIEGKHVGKGGALTRGFNESNGDVLGFLDADLSARPSELDKLFIEVEKRNADLAIGSRELSGSVIPIKQPSHRHFLGTIYSLLARLLFGVRIHDFQCGCKAFSSELWKTLNIRAEGFVFDTELIAKTHAKGFMIKEIPITWSNDRQSRVNPISDPLRMFIGLISIKFQLLKAKWAS